MRFRPVAAAALLAFVALAGCTSGDPVPVNSPSSPLGGAGAGGDNCAWAWPGYTMTNGFIVLENHSKGTVTIESVSYYRPRHIVIAAAVVVPIRFDAIGIQLWPPRVLESGVQWDKRTPAAGAKVPPDSGDHFRNLVLATRITAHRGTAAGVTVRYREGGQQYILRTRFAINVVHARAAYGCS
jgi:hypothetical protein